MPFESEIPPSIPQSYYLVQAWILQPLPPEEHVPWLESTAPIFHDLYHTDNEFGQIINDIKSPEDPRMQIIKDKISLALAAKNKKPEAA